VNPEAPLVMPHVRLLPSDKSMLTLSVIITLGALGYLSAALARERGGAIPSISMTALRVAVGIALVRIAILLWWSSLLESAGKVRPLVFLLVVANSAIEFQIIKGLHGVRDWPGPAFIMAGLIGLTSALLGFAWARVRSRPRSGMAA
jgi:hypothetical protein